MVIFTILVVEAASFRLVAQTEIGDRKFPDFIIYLLIG